MLGILSASKQRKLVSVVRACFGQELRAKLKLRRRALKCLIEVYLSEPVIAARCMMDNE
jgi:hypothetical protein